MVDYQTPGDCLTGVAEPGSCVMVDLFWTPWGLIPWGGRFMNTWRILNQNLKYFNLLVRGSGGFKFILKKLQLEHLVGLSLYYITPILPPFLTVNTCSELQCARFKAKKEQNRAKQSETEQRVI